MVLISSVQAQCLSRFFHFPSISFLFLGAFQVFTNGCAKCLPHWAGLFTATAAKSLQSCPTLCDPIDVSPPGSPGPWDSSGKNTGMGCHFLLQCMDVKSESEAAQSYPTLCDSMDCSLPGSSDFPGKSTGVGCHCLLRPVHYYPLNIQFKYIKWKLKQLWWSAIWNADG